MPDTLKRPETIRLTRYNRLFSVVPDGHETLTWPAVIATLSTHRPYATKDNAPGFGAHTLVAGGQRRIADVESVSLFVFDVDVGTVDDILRTETLLRSAGIAAHFYSSYSYTPDHNTPPFRLVIPPDRPIHPDEYDFLRAHLIERFAIPCDPKKCSSVAHFWFLPSHPHGQQGVTETLPGVPFPVDSVAPPALRLRHRASGVRSRSTDVTYTPPPEPSPDEPVDLTELRKKVAAHAKRVAIQGDKQKAEYLKRLLAGEALAEHGDRNNSLIVTTGSVTWTNPDTPLSHFVLLFRPSLESMMAAGSSLTYDDLERMLLTGMEGKATQDAEFERLKVEIRGLVKK